MGRGAFSTLCSLLAQKLPMAVAREDEFNRFPRLKSECNRKMMGFFTHKLIISFFSTYSIYNIIMIKILT